MCNFQDSCTQLFDGVTLGSTLFLFTQRSIPPNVMSWDEAGAEAKKSGLKKFEKAIRKYVKLRNWRKKSHQVTECYTSFSSACVMRTIFQTEGSSWKSHTSLWTSKLLLLGLLCFLEGEKKNAFEVNMLCVYVCVRAHARLIPFQLLKQLTDFDKTCWEYHATYSTTLLLL